MKKNINKYIGFFMICLLMLACKKNDPIGDLGSTNNEFASQLTVTYNNTKPAFGNKLVITASTWQRDDKFQKVDIYETIVESFGIQMALKSGTSVLTKTADESTLTVVDPIVTKNVLIEVNAADLDKYWVTATNNYVINHEYSVDIKQGKYKNDVTLIAELNDVDFDVLKGILAYSITKLDYLALFPTAPATHFTASGTYVLTAAGMANLKQNLTRAMLTNQVQTIKKVGNYSLTIDVDAITPTNAKTSSTRTFDITL